MRNAFSFLFTVISLTVFVQCKEEKRQNNLNEKYNYDRIDEKSKYEIINLVLKDHFSKHRNYTDTKLSDSTVLTYLLSANFYKVDTLNYDYQTTKEKINLSKIENIKFAELIHFIPCKDTLYLDNCSKNFLGKYSFSKIQLNEKRNKAIINIGFHCGGKCGDESNYYLNKINNSWKIKSHRVAAEY